VAVASVGTIRKSSAPRSRQITMPVPRHSVFTGWMPFLTPNQHLPITKGTQPPTIRGWKIDTSQGAVLCDWEGNRRFGIALAMHYRLITGSTCLRKRDKHPIYSSLRTMANSFLHKQVSVHTAAAIAFDTVQSTQTSVNIHRSPAQTNVSAVCTR